MLALAIEFSRCSKARTLKAEQCVLMMIPFADNPFAPWGLLAVAVREGVKRITSASTWSLVGYEQVHWLKDWTSRSAKGSLERR